MFFGSYDHHTLNFLNCCTVVVVLILICSIISWQWVITHQSSAKGACNAHSSSSVVVHQSVPTPNQKVQSAKQNGEEIVQNFPYKKIVDILWRISSTHRHLYFEVSNLETSGFFYIVKYGSPHPVSEIDVEGSLERIDALQICLRCIVISRVVFEIKPSNSKNDTKNFYKENTQKITICVSLLVLHLILVYLFIDPSTEVSKCL